MEMDMDTYYQFLHNQEQYQKAEDNRSSQRKQWKEGNLRLIRKELAEKRRLAEMLWTNQDPVSI